MPGLKFVARLVIVSEKEAWEDVAELYGVLIGYMTDDRFKVGEFYFERLSLVII